MDYPAGFAVLMRRLPRLAQQAMDDAARAYAGIVARPGRSGVSNWREGIVQRRFTATNTHGFTALSNKARFVVVRRKSDGRWIGFPYPGYATWKRQRFGNKPILVATGRLRESLHRAVLTRSGDTVTLRFQVPDYGKRHHDGDGVPKRSPVQPNSQDRQMVKDRAKLAMQTLVKIEGARLGVKVRT